MRLCTVLTLLSLLAMPALAQLGDERARLHFESGRAYYEEGAYERALTEFQEAYALSARTAMLYNIATTMERLGMYSEAADTFQRYVSESPDLEGRDTFERRIENLRRRVANGGTASPSNTTSTGTTASSGDSSDGLVLGGAIALGVGGAGLVAFGILGGLALSAQSDVEGGCALTTSCTPSDVADMDSFAMGADISLIVGGSVAAAALVLLILGIASDSSTDSARLDPILSPTFAGVRLTGSI